MRRRTKVALGRRLSRCREGSAEGARAWLEVAALASLFARLLVEPA